MKYTVAVIATFATVAVAQSGLADLPACAQACLLTGVQATGCALTDFKCSCSNTAFVTSSGTCIAKSCTGSDITKAIQAAAAICSSVGITIPTTIPGGAASSTSAAAPPSSSAAPSTSAAAPSTSAAAPSTSAAAPSVYSSAVTTSTKAVAPTTSASNGTVATSVPPPAASGGAGSIVASGALAAVGAVAAFFF